MASIPVGCSRDELKQHSCTVVSQMVFTGNAAFTHPHASAASPESTIAPCAFHWVTQTTYIRPAGENSKHIGKKMLTLQAYGMLIIQLKLVKIFWFGESLSHRLAIQQSAVSGYHLFNPIESACGLRSRQQTVMCTTSTKASLHKLF